METYKMGNVQVERIESVIDSKGRKRGSKGWVICPVCSRGRWIRVDAARRKSFTGMCSKCHNKFTSNSGENHPRWKVEL